MQTHNTVEENISHLVWSLNLQDQNTAGCAANALALLMQNHPDSVATVASHEAVIKHLTSLCHSQNPAHAYMANAALVLLQSPPFPERVPLLLWTQRKMVMDFVNARRRWTSG